MGTLASELVRVGLAKSVAGLHGTMPTQHECVVFARMCQRHALIMPTCQQSFNRFAKLVALNSSFSLQGAKKLLLYVADKQSIYTRSQMTSQARRRHGGMGPIVNDNSHKAANINRKLGRKLGIFRV